MSRVDITAVSRMTQWQELIEKERGHHVIRRDFTANPKTMAVITEKPHQSSFSRAFAAQRAAEQKRLDEEETAAAAALAANGGIRPSTLRGQPKYGGGGVVRTTVVLTSPLTHTSTVVGAGPGVPPQTPPAASATTVEAAMAAKDAAIKAKAGVATKFKRTLPPAEDVKSQTATAAPAQSAFAAANSLSAAGATISRANATVSGSHSPVRRTHPLSKIDPVLASTLRRHELTPTEKYEWPQTSNHEYGWNSQPVMPPDRATKLWWKGLKSSDISEYVSNYVTTQGGKTPFSTQTSGNRPAALPKT